MTGARAGERIGRFARQITVTPFRRFAAPAALLATAAMLVAACGPAASRPGGAGDAERIPNPGRPATSSPTPTANPRDAGDCGPFPPRHAWAAAISADGTIRWRTPIRVGAESGGEQLPPLVIAGLVVLAQDGDTVALDPAGGHLAWRWHGGDTVSDLWGWHDLVVVLTDQVSRHATLTGLHAATGAVAWHTSIPDNGLMGFIHPTGDGAVAWVRSDGLLQVVGLDDGKPRWSHPADRESAVATVPGTVLADRDGTLTGYDADTGAVRWTVKGLPADPALTVAGGLALVTSSASGGDLPTAMTAVDPATGRVLWRFDTHSDITVLDGTSEGIAVATYVPKRRLYLLDPSTGKPRWTANAAVSLDTRPVFAGGLLVAAEGDVAGIRPKLVAHDLGSGRTRWSQPLHGAIVGRAPLTRWGRAVVLAQLGDRPHDGSTMRAFDLATGAPRWQATVPSFLQAPALLAGDLLIVHPTDPDYACAA